MNGLLQNLRVFVASGFLLIGVWLAPTHLIGPDAGLVEEVRGLRAKGFDSNLPSLQAIGYREVGALLAGEMNEAETREAIASATRRYAKRQRTWFRAEAGVEWADAEQPEAALEAALVALDS